MQVRRLQPHELQLLKTLRLAALRDSPQAFGENAQDAEEETEQYWTELIVELTAPGGDVMFVAENAHASLGFAHGIVDRQDDQLARVGGMWVAPAARGQRVGAAMLGAILGWARQCGKRRIELWVTQGNPAAARLYADFGFRSSGKTQPMPHTPATLLEELYLELGAR